MVEIKASEVKGCHRHIIYGEIFDMDYIILATEVVSQYQRSQQGHLVTREDENGLCQIEILADVRNDVVIVLNKPNPSCIRKIKGEYASK